MIASVRGFTDYFEGVRRRTVGFFRALPPDHIDWAPRASEYTAGDIIRHVAACEPMFVGAWRPWCPPWSRRRGPSRRGGC